MPNKKTKQTKSERKYHARILFKSGASQEFFITNTDSGVYVDLQRNFERHLKSPNKEPAYGTYTIPVPGNPGNGWFTVRWSEVDAIFWWVD